MKKTTNYLLLILAALLLATAAPDAAWGKKNKKKVKAAEDYSEYVWPAPPEEARIQLQAILTGRADVEAESKLKRALIGASPQSVYDRLTKPFAVAIDEQERILVTDPGNAALIRFDLHERRLDVFGTQGRIRLRVPLGMDVTQDGVIYVADVGLKQVVAFNPEGRINAVFGRGDELANPTDAAVSPDGSRLYVADSKAHKILVYGIDKARLLSEFGEAGEGEGQFKYPTSLTFGPEGELFVVDQINSRVQLFTPEGEYLDEFGGLGVGFGDFVRPKDIVVDEVGFIYVTDNAFNNFQIFDADFSLLTFVGEGGTGPGRFLGSSGIAVRGDAIAVVDQVGARVQIFRFLIPKDQ